MGSQSEGPSLVSVWGPQKLRCSVNLWGPHQSVGPSVARMDNRSVGHSESGCVALNNNV